MEIPGLENQVVESARRGVEEDDGRAAGEILGLFRGAYRPA